MKIVICSSMRFKDSIVSTIAMLQSLGLEPLFPNLNYTAVEKGVVETPQEIKRLARDHFDAIDTADCVYMITTGGYMGTSCKLELGYAVAKGMPVYFSESTNDPALDCYAVAFIPLHSLESFLKL